MLLPKTIAKLEAGLTPEEIASAKRAAYGPLPPEVDPDKKEIYQNLSYGRLLGTIKNRKEEQKRAAKKLATAQRIAAAPPPTREPGKSFQPPQSAAPSAPPLIAAPAKTGRERLAAKIQSTLDRKKK